MRRVVSGSDPQSLEASNIALPDEDLGERQHFVFYQDEGGLGATDESNAPLERIYYLGVIDILTPYTPLKKLEHVWKGLQADRVRRTVSSLSCKTLLTTRIRMVSQHKISPVPPAEYADRFFAFMKAIMRGGESPGPAHFKAE